jgi:nucleotide-binding universal stress UspA family protein
MQDSAHTRHIVVGVDGSLVARSAVLWAACEARLRKCGLIITHIDPPQMDAVGLDRGKPVHGEAVSVNASPAAAKH